MRVPLVGVTLLVEVLGVGRFEGGGVIVTFGKGFDGPGAEAAGAGFKISPLAITGPLVPFELCRFDGGGVTITFGKDFDGPGAEVVGAGAGISPAVLTALGEICGLDGFGGEGLVGPVSVATLVFVSCGSGGCV